MRFEKRGVKPFDVPITVTKEGVSPPLSTVRIRFKLTDEMLKNFNSGKEFLKQKQYGKALEMFRKVEAALPDYENLKELIAECEKHIPSPAECERLFVSGKAHFSKRRWEKAIADLIRIPESYKGYGESQAIISIARKEIKKREKLRQLIEQAAQHLAAAELTQAERIAQEALKIDTINDKARTILTNARNVRDYYNGAVAAFDAKTVKDLTRARRLLEKVLEIVPTHHDAITKLQIVKETIKQEEARLKSIEEELEKARNALLRKKAELALTCARRVLVELDPTNREAQSLAERAIELLNIQQITAIIMHFDSLFSRKRLPELLALFHQEKTEMKKQLETEFAQFFAKEIEIWEASHKELDITIADNTAQVECVFVYNFRVVKVDARIRDSIKRKIELLREENKWYITGFAEKE